MGLCAAAPLATPRALADPAEADAVQFDLRVVNDRVAERSMSERAEASAPVRRVSTAEASGPEMAAPSGGAAWLEDWYDAPPEGSDEPSPYVPLAPFDEPRAEPSDELNPAAELNPPAPLNPPAHWCGDGCVSGWCAGLRSGPPQWLSAAFDNGYWLFRPFSVSWFTGIMFADNPLPNLDLNTGFFGGLRLGWDYSDHWGVETRVAFADVDISNTVVGQSPKAEVFIWDGDLLFYPLGDARLRPYCLIGLGATRVQFVDQSLLQNRAGLFSGALGVGIRYRHSSRVALRFEFLDNIAFGATSNLQDMHNLTLTGGMEFHFGGSRTSYWPWQPGKKVW